jgi:signal transduction histidine kinase
MTPRSKQASIRLRLTLVYAAVLVATCAALLALNYALLYGSLYRNIHAPTSAPTKAAASAVAGGAPSQEDEEKLRIYQADQAEIARLRAHTLTNTAETAAIALAITAIVGLGVSWIVAGRIVRPLRTLTATTRRISQDRLHERVALTGPHDELKELADTFDEMVARLEASFNSQRRFVADAAHELRTPLAIARTGAEVQLAKRHTTPEQWQATAHRVLSATSRAERILDGLLAIARSDSGVIVEQPHDLAIAAAAALSEADGEAELAGLTITTDLRPAPVNGDPALLDRLVSNLVNNAILHNHPGGWIEVTTHDRDGVGVLTVRNSGDRIPATEVDRLFEPFQRLEPHRAEGARSTGLGLAIVRSIVRVHRGTVEAAAIAEGGLAVTVALPTRHAPRVPTKASEPIHAKSER